MTKMFYCPTLPKGNNLCIRKADQFFWKKGRKEKKRKKRKEKEKKRKNPKNYK